MHIPKIVFAVTIAAFSLSSAFAQEKAAQNTSANDSRVTSTIKTEANGDIFLVQEMSVKAPVEKVWNAFATTEGWTSWSVPVGEVDMKIGGTIKSNYRKDGKLTDDDTITLNIINYVPQRALTLQAELGPHFPEILKSREKQMYNLITFSAIDANNTRINSYGIGYKDSPELQRMLQFFVKGNEQSYEKLINYLESGVADPLTKSEVK